MFKSEGAVVLIPDNMGSSWTKKKSQKHLPNNSCCSFPIVDPPQTPPNHLHPSAYEGTREPVGPVLFPLLISSQPFSSKCLPGNPHCGGCVLGMGWTLQRNAELSQEDQTWGIHERQQWKGWFDLMMIYHWSSQTKQQILFMISKGTTTVNTI